MSLMMLETPVPSTARQQLTAADLWSLPDEKEFELVNGELMERDMSWESERIATNVLSLLWMHCRQTNSGEVVGSNAGYQCFSIAIPDDPERLRKPDVSYISAARLPREPINRGYCRIAPDLAVEVVSPNDLSEELETKIQEYLAAGVRLVWIVHPIVKTVRIHRSNGTVHVLRQPNEVLSGEEVIPGFQCSLSDIFRIPQSSNDITQQPNHTASGQK